MNNTLSIVIPSSEDRWLAATINDVFAKASGPVEVIAVINGYTPTRTLPERDGLTYLFQERASMRGALNAARAHVRGEWVAKSDEHCLFSEGFDEVLKAECDRNWLLIPRRHSLNVGTEEDPKWEVENNPKGPRDYHYLSCPVWSLREKSDYSMHGLEWLERTRERLGKPEYDTDGTLSWQGSFYFMHRTHYDWLGPMDETRWGGFAGEPQEIGLKTQLGGGMIAVTKKCYYAHLHKGKRWQRGYRPNKAEISAGHEFNAWYWMTDQWPVDLGKRCRPMRWLIEHWWPIPTWPADTLERWDYYFPAGASLELLKERARA